ncbi:MAG: methyltransferase domain-containing protein [Cyclobacteriaceae bacterium]
MKQIISFLLRKVPRKYLQLVSHYGLAILALFYKGNKVECPVCKSRFRVFLPYGRQSRSNALCPSCLSLERHRLMWLFLERQTGFFKDEAKLLHIAPEHCFIDRFEKLDNLDYVTADIESPLAKVKMDAHDIPFENESFEMVFCNHVLEHVNDDKKVMSEIYRVMKPGGFGILQIPLFFPLAEKTIEDPSITDPKKREELFGQDDHVRMYGLDYRSRLEDAGFKVRDDYANSLSPEELHKFGIIESEILYTVHK